MAIQGLEQVIQADQEDAIAKVTRERLSFVATEDRYVGELWQLNFDEATVMVHDFNRKKVGGIPNQCFLVATRMRALTEIRYSDEDASLILLRVLDAAALPAESEMSRIRAEAGQRAVGVESFWDEQSIMDGHTANFLSFAGLKCRVVGTFYLEQSGEALDQVALRFGGDIPNFYPNRALKVYKPSATALSLIVNYRDMNRSQSTALGQNTVKLGTVRYASTNRLQHGVEDVVVSLAPADLLGQKTALFGMTRTGKSNTTKMMARAIFALRFAHESGGRIGQLILDYNGEYANDNVQDASGGLQRSALKNVWKVEPRGKAEDVVTYGTYPHKNDPNRRLMLFNFFDQHMLQAGKEVIDAVLQTESSSAYIGNFRDVVFSNAPPDTDHSAKIRFNRNVLAYRALLTRAGFEPPSSLNRPNVNGLFGTDLINALTNAAGLGADPENKYASAAAHLRNNAAPSWSQLAEAIANLREFIHDNRAGYSAFNANYMAAGRDRWNDSTFDKIIGVFQYPNGSRLIGRVKEQHSPSVDRDYRDAIYDDLKTGRLVIIDQSQGNAELNKMSADRVMTRILSENQSQFSRGDDPAQLLVYVEEAHNLLPHGNDDDLRNVWVRTAKEGAKLRIGMVYITQEVSSIQKNILKNTANWFIGHLNNSDETKELRKYYDFVDFEPSILKAQDQGFLRVKTISNMFVIPVQVDRFEVG